ncbi:MAG TPA: carboxypeptidase-like regulatory domain-containing protein, partial [Salinivirgaceae bacterium]|nr:carboxypeptidase-like regulatory domain-containing protein [Salinivirgaceae bacterium]
MFRYFTLSLISLIFVCKLFAQKAVITGRILDQDKYPVDMASVVCKETQQGTLSNSLGRYEIEVPANTLITIVHTRVGYEETTVNVNLSEGERLKLEVPMRQTVHNIDE